MTGGMDEKLMLHLSAGQGPAECAWVVARLADAFVEEAKRLGLGCRPLDAVDGLSASLLLWVEGMGAGTFAAERTGTIRWVGTSKLRPNHKRRNWFVGVSRVDEGLEVQGLDDADIVYRACRASGPGGQHVNKTDSAVRAIHVPTGLVCFSQEERSQHANRRLARLKLAMLFEEKRTAGQAAGRLDRWNENQGVERGNAIRSYEGEAFRLRR